MRYSIMRRDASAPAAVGSLLFGGGAPGSINQCRLAIPRTGTPGSIVSIGNEDFTVEFFARCTTGNATGVVTATTDVTWQYCNIIIDGDTGFRPRGWGFGIGEGRFCFGLDTDVGARTIGGGSSGTDWRNNTWVHVAGERRRSDGLMRLYVNGIMTDSSDGPDGDLSYAGGTPVAQCGPSGNLDCGYSDTVIAVGVEKADLDHATYPGYFGHFAEFRICNVLRYGGSNFTPPTTQFTPGAGTLALYHFGEGSGTNAFDSSGNAITAQLRVGATGPAWSALSPF